VTHVIARTIKNAETVIVKSRASMTTGVESTTMGTAVVSINGNSSGAEQCEVPLLGLASAIAFGVAGSLLGYSFFSRKRRLPISGQICLGVLAGCAGVVTWMKREEEMEAAHHVIHHVHEVRDARWLRKNPVAYG
jgi:hypothetical protein